MDMVRGCGQGKRRIPLTFIKSKKLAAIMAESFLIEAYRTKSVSGGFIQSTEYGYLVLWCNSSQTSPSPHFSGFSRPSALMP